MQSLPQFLIFFMKSCCIEEDWPPHMGNPNNLIVTFVVETITFLKSSGWKNLFVKELSVQSLCMCIRCRNQLSKNVIYFVDLRITETIAEIVIQTWIKVSGNHGEDNRQNHFRNVHQRYVWCVIPVFVNVHTCTCWDSSGLMGRIHMEVLFLFFTFLLV